jgi:uncharacterized protein (TIGR02466 family)
METIDIFSSPVCLRMVNDPGLAAALTTHLVAEAGSHPGITRSNIGGWHSVPDLTLRRSEPFPSFFQRLVSELDATLAELGARRRVAAPRYRYGIQSWAMVMARGDYTVLHDHAEAHLSGVFYADAGDPAPEPSGHLAFVRPGGGIADLPGLALAPTTFQVRPQTGLLVVFPGYLQHYVHAYQGQRPRVAISFNVRAEVVHP